MPVPMHMVTMPYLPPVRRRPWTTVVVRMAPVAPRDAKGDGAAQGLTLSGLRPSSRITAMDWAAKALVEFDPVQIVLADADLLQDLRNRRHRPDAHDLRRHAADRIAGKPGQRSQVVLAQDFPKPASPRPPRPTSGRSCRPSPNPGRGTRALSLARPSGVESGRGPLVGFGKPFLDPDLAAREVGQSFAHSIGLISALKCPAAMAAQALPWGCRGKGVLLVAADFPPGRHFSAVSPIPKAIPRFSSFSKMAGSSPACCP